MTNQSKKLSENKSSGTGNYQKHTRQTILVNRGVLLKYL